MLTGCIENWSSMKGNWSFETLLKRYGDNVTWKADVSLGKNSLVTMDMLNLNPEEWPELRQDGVSNFIRAKFCN